MRNCGFTLVEMLVVIILIGILAANALPRFLGVSNDALRALNYATVATLNSAVTNVTQKAKLPGALMTVTGFTAGANNGKTSVYVVNIDNNTNISPNNYVAFSATTDATTMPGTIPIGGAKEVYSNAPTQAILTTTGTSLVAYADITGSTPSTGCTNLFNVLMGSGSTQTATAGTLTSAYQTLVISPAGTTAFTTINGATGSAFTSGSIAAGKIASSVLTTAAVPHPTPMPPATPTTAASGACLYLLNNSTNPLFLIIYDATKGLFYEAEF